MTIQFYVYSIAKRAEALTLVDLGATKNFINLTYTKWLKLPIQQLSQPRKIFNIDGTTNKSGNLQYYTDLKVQTGNVRTLLCFFLTDLRDNKAILKYLWFAATQPKIDWKHGWIDSSQLPIILRAPNMKKACFTPCLINKPQPVYCN
jgi:hypothetical protein